MSVAPVIVTTCSGPFKVAPPPFSDVTDIEVVAEMVDRPVSGGGPLDVAKELLVTDAAVLNRDSSASLPRRLWVNPAMFAYVYRDWYARAWVFVGKEGRNGLRGEDVVRWRRFLHLIKNSPVYIVAVSS
jgi:hypothetical protein